ncbi:unnamed protein product [Nippostrongylus brasiliensis]|uniref:Ovule protein n=1 Tax=Nippostrongylus brasiliensis TaxID=27835 RepID=A0A0N4XQM0_NIPBR|nr:unnamed protein product [Nippostrongylus brasiliensis]
MTTVFKDYAESLSAPTMYHHSMALEADQNVPVSEMIMSDTQDVINVNNDDNGFASPIKPAPFYTAPTDAMYYTNNFKDYGKRPRNVISRLFLDSLALFITHLSLPPAFVARPSFDLGSCQSH